MRKIRTKSSNKRKLIFNIFLFLFLLIGVGYSTVFTNLGINGDIILLNYRDLNIKQTSSTDRTAFRSDTYRENIKTITISDSISIPSNVISSWDISETGNGGVMAYIVKNANDNTKYDLYIQGDGKVYTNRDSSYIFSGLTSLDTITGLNKLTTTKTSNMSNMFNGDSNLAIIDLSNFNMSKVTNTTDMLTGTTSLINLTTPKTYPTDNNITITLPTTLYDTNNVGYSTLNNASPTETFIKDDDRILVTFDANEGTTSTTQKVVTLDSAYGTLPTPTREGYYFLGWNGKNMYNYESYSLYYIDSNGEPVPKEYPNNNYDYISDYISVTSNQEYIFSLNREIYNIGIAYYDNNKTFITRIDNFSHSSITINPTQDGYVRVWVLDLTTPIYNSNISNCEIQMEVGTTRTTYEPYYIKNTTNVTQNINHTLKAKWIQKEYNFDTVGSHEFVVPLTGTYKLETWGAQGGNSSNVFATNQGGYGGYSTGNIIFTINNTVYVVVGGTANEVTDINGTSGGFNGGGSGGAAAECYPEREYHGGAGGGGATHIANTLGELYSLSNKISDILIVSGGGGGATSHWDEGLYGGSAGGFEGSAGQTCENPYKNSPCTAFTSNNSGGTQNSGYSFGKGQNGLAVSDNSGWSQSGRPGGGGGFYGGYTSQTLTNGAAAAGGGSGYIGNSLLNNKAMYCYECHESLANSTDSEKNIFTVSTTGSSSYKDSTNCPNGYNTSAISKCAKAGNGYARITIININN